MYVIDHKCFNTHHVRREKRHHFLGAQLVSARLLGAVGFMMVRLSDENHGIHPANQRKPKEIKGYQRTHEIIYEKLCLASSFVFLVVSFGFLTVTQLKIICWCNPCVGKVDSGSFWPIPWWKCGTPVTENTLVLIGGEKKKHKKTRGLQRRT